jgi:hypothetical protein
MTEKGVARELVIARGINPGGVRWVGGLRMERMIWSKPICSI